MRTRQWGIISLAKKNHSYLANYIDFPIPILQPILPPDST